MSMKMGAVALCFCLLAAAVWLGLSMTTSESLEVFYPEVGNISCKIVPQCNEYRQKIQMWSEPIVKFPEALDDTQYLLVMVDPDAPSRHDNRAKYWRHWVVSNIKGSDIKAGNIRGNVITDYQPPSPPPTTGLHRYQFFVYLQGDRDISIPTKENRNRASWKLEKFLQDHKLQSHESSTQYMTEHDDTVLQYYKMNEAKGKSSET
ncbi:phosphatidylethanolamine-binding protein 4 [Cricetulus griseus]|uniref:Phosphatidylethanolamine-binding protein 4 n=1 Tax=Cricetulus griseus TaxID=10029 RepID=A0A9J7HBE7_CRIGR|nr:phosphatidylethanolamine-binding protein 4 [Cricetulus griseus]XP_035315048.1 phosphatidylethanolamine-binding protein 4 [Cricetulus griseus]